MCGGGEDQADADEEVVRFGRGDGDTEGDDGRQSGPPVLTRREGDAVPAGNGRLSLIFQKRAWLRSPQAAHTFRACHPSIPTGRGGGRGLADAPLPIARVSFLKSANSPRPRPSFRLPAIHLSEG